jgi:hypothetical protein
MSFPDETTEAITRYPLPDLYVTLSAYIAKWIDVTVPCVTSEEQSEAVTDEVVSYLRGRGVADVVISEALSKSVYKYPFTRQTAHLYMQVRWHEQQSNDTMGTAPPGDPEKDMWRARDIDQKFLGASVSGDRSAMEKFAKMLLDLLDAYGRAKGGKERMDEVGREILRNAPNIRPLIRVVGPEPPVPGPDGRTPRRVGPNTYVLDEDALEKAEADAEGEADREAD